MEEVVPKPKVKKVNRTLEECFREKYPKGSATYKKLTGLVGRYLAKNGLAAYTVESTTFREMLTGFDSR